MNPLTEKEKVLPQIIVPQVIIHKITQKFNTEKSVYLDL